MRAVAALLTVLLAACAVVEPLAVRAAPTATVDSLIGDAPCDADSQCRTIAVGAKACGGPEGYRAWSTRGTDGAALQSAGEREMQIARKRVEASGILSNCAVVADPGAYCAAPLAIAGAGASSPVPKSSTTRQCRLRPAASGGASKIY